jgi:ketosteroid isomerase-like protein
MMSAERFGSLDAPGANTVPGGMPAATPEACDVVVAEYIGAGDLDTIVALYEPAAVLIDAASGAPLEGHAAIRRSFAALVAAKTRIECRVVKVVRSGELALCYNDWTGSMAGPDGARIQIGGHAMEVVRRQPDGTWRYVLDDPNARG